MTKIHGGLLEAYKGYFEDDWEIKDDYQRYVAREREKGESTVKAFDSWLEEECERLIREHSPAVRLEIYCEWNGILGYHRTLFAIANGEFEA